MRKYYKLYPFIYITVHTLGKCINIFVYVSQRVSVVVKLYNKVSKVCDLLTNHFLGNDDE